MCMQLGMLHIFDAEKLGKPLPLSSESDNITWKISALVSGGYGCGLDTLELLNGGAHPPTNKIHATCDITLIFFFYGPASLPIELGVKAGLPTPSML